MELRGYPYLSIVGSQGWFANAEFRFPIIDVMKTPIGILGPVRGTLFAGIGGAHFQGDNYEFGTSDEGRSYVRDHDLRRAGVRVSPGGRTRVVRCRAAVLLPGLPACTSTGRRSPTWRCTRRWQFSFWIGYDF